MDFTPQQAAEAARNGGIDLDKEKIAPETLAAGMAAESARHGTKDAATNVVADDPVIAAKLALANLRVSPNYYSPKTGREAWEFQLSPPVRGVTISNLTRLVKYQISTLTPFAGCDVMTALLRRPVVISTLSPCAWHDTKGRGQYLFRDDFNSHAL